MLAVREKTSLGMICMLKLKVFLTNMALFIEIVQVDDLQWSLHKAECSHFANI